MRTTRMRRPGAFAAISMTSAALLLAVACGGGKTGDAKDPSGPATSSAPSASSGSVAAAPNGAGDTGPARGATTTTTTALDASDLQGARLGSSSRKEIEIKGDAGPRAPPGGRAGEPGRNVEDIGAVVRARRDEARACYDRSLKDHPGIEGNLDVKWVIDPQGDVSDVSVDHQRSSIHEASVGACIVDIIKKMKFARSQKGFETRAHYPFDFHPNSASAGKDAGK